MHRKRRHSCRCKLESEITSEALVRPAIRSRNGRFSIPRFVFRHIIHGSKYVYLGDFAFQCSKYRVFMDLLTVTKVSARGRSFESIPN